MAVTKARSVKICVMACSLYSCQTETSTIKKTEITYQTSTTVTNSLVGTLLGVRLTISSSTPSRKEMMMTRTFTSHASHARSLNLLSVISVMMLEIVGPRPEPGPNAGLIDVCYPE